MQQHATDCILTGFCSSCRLLELNVSNCLLILTSGWTHVLAVLKDHSGWNMWIRLKEHYAWHFAFHLFWTWITFMLPLVRSPVHTHGDHCFPAAVALIRRDSSCSFGTNNYLTSCHNQIPLIMGTIQRLPGVIKLARVFLDFQLSPACRALYPWLWLWLWLGALCCTGADSSSRTITMRLG